MESGRKRREAVRSGPQPHEVTWKKKGIFLEDEQFKSHFGYTSPRVQKQEDKSPKLVRKPVRLISGL